MSEKRPATWQSRRLPNCDYGSPGEYFVTLCTRGRACLFGEIVEGLMRLSPEGNIAETAWRNLPIHHGHLALDAFVIMPNHLHGILLFNAPGAALGTVIGGFKSEVTRLVRRPMWQRYYCDNVIRSREGLDRIRSYIEETRRAGRTMTSILTFGTLRGGQARLLRLCSRADYRFFGIDEERPDKCA
jgi:putative transposase